MIWNAFSLLLPSPTSVWCPSTQSRYDLHPILWNIFAFEQKVVADVHWAVQACEWWWTALYTNRQKWLVIPWELEHVWRDWSWQLVVVQGSIHVNTKMSVMLFLVPRGIAKGLVHQFMNFTCFDLWNTDIKSREANPLMDEGMCPVNWLHFKYLFMGI